MKPLILIQNDVSGSGKTTLRQALQGFLTGQGRGCLAVRVVENETELAAGADEALTVTVETLRAQGVGPYYQVAPRVLLEVEGGLGAAVAEALEESGLAALGVDVVVAVPVTGEAETFAGVTEAAQLYGETARYAVFHAPDAGDYEVGFEVWERSRAARVMDLLDGLDIPLPAVPQALETELRTIDLELAEALGQAWLPGGLQERLDGWREAVAAALEPASRFLFGEAMASRPVKRSVRRRKGAAGTLAGVGNW